MGALRLLEQHYQTLAERGKLSTDDLVTMFQSLDEDGDGVVSFGEWRGYLKRSGMSEAKRRALIKLFYDLDQAAIFLSLPTEYLVDVHLIFSMESEAL